MLVVNVFLRYRVSGATVQNDILISYLVRPCRSFRFARVCGWSAQISP